MLVVTSSRLGREGQVEHVHAEPLGDPAAIARAAAHGQHQIGPHRRDRDQAAVIARVTPCRRPERRLGRILGEMGDRGDLLRRGEQQQQLVRAQVERRDPPRLAMQPARRAPG